MVAAHGDAAADPPPAPAKTPSKATAVPPVIEGIVKGPDGRPIEKALVVARVVGASRLDLPVTARTDAKGGFRLGLKRAGIYDVRVEAKGLAARPSRRSARCAPLDHHWPRADHSKERSAMPRRVRRSSGPVSKARDVREPAVAGDPLAA